MSFNYNFKFILISILIIFCFLIIYFNFFFNETEYINADSGNTYLLKNYEDKNTAKDSANALDQINKNNIILIDYLLKIYPNIYWIQKLSSNYKRNGSGGTSLSEAAINSSLTSFTIDKKDMNICLRTRDKKNILYDYNTLMYVIIHELSHMGNYDLNGNAIEGHGKEFIEKFKFILKTAIKLNLYQWVDYKQFPKEYCGILISSQILSQQEL